jgi:hypothetical protein
MSGLIISFVIHSAKLVFSFMRTKLIDHKCGEILLRVQKIWCLKKSFSRIISIFDYLIFFCTFATYYFYTEKRLLIYKF